MGWIYLLHFDSPISEAHTCQHYLGYTDRLWGRLAEHNEGRGSRLCEVAKERGIRSKLARVWEGSYRDERWLKSWKKGSGFCPICQERPANPNLEEVNFDVLM